jgi:hypothetical protein
VPEVELHLNGQGPFRLIVATALQQTALDAAVADRLGLTPGPRAWVGKPEAPGSVSGEQIRIDSLRLGEIELRDVEAVRIDVAELTGGESPQGILGIGPFKGRLLTLDFAESSLKLETGSLPLPDGESILAYELDELSRPTIPIQVAGEKVPSHLDTIRFGGLALHSRYMEILPMATKPGIIGRTLNGEGSFDLYGGTLDGTLQIGTHSVQRPRVLFSEISEVGNLGPAR